jgi:kynurenine formamidase
MQLTTASSQEKAQLSEAKKTNIKTKAGAKARAAASSIKAKQKRKVSPKGNPRRVARTSNAGSARQRPKLPSFDALLKRTDAPAGSAWGLFGPDDELGTMNFLTDETVRQASTEIKRGRVFSLNMPLSFPQMFARGPYKQVVILPTGRRGRDDYLDNFYLQGSSQWDALCHVKHPSFGAYNGIPEEQLPGSGGIRLGIHNVAQRGIAGRGVLADVARFYERHGESIDYSTRHVIPLKDVRATLDEQKSPLKAGDILLVRIGFTRYLKSNPEIIHLTSNRAAAIPGSPGIEASRATLRWLWDNHLAAVATDGAALEATPLDWESDGCLHHHMLGMLGMQIGELWELDPLAEDCDADKKYTFFLTSAPLNVAGGVGSPPNALAIK